MTVGAVAGFVAAYLLGSVDFAVLVARARGADIYELGSGNPGAANVMRSLGWKAAVPVMLGDLAKGAVAAWVGTVLGGSEVAGFAAGFAAVLGHCFPVWHRFRGGKGVATALGAVIWMEPLVGLALVVVWALLLALTKVSSIGSLVATALMVPGVALAGASPWSLVWVGAVTVLVLTRHRENIRRLAGGEERSIRADTPPN